MAKKGVSVISGNISPTVGEKNTYRIVDWYKDTPLSERDPAKVTWELFRKRKDGRFTTTNIRKKGDSSFTFGEAAIGNTYRLEGYLYQPEGGGLIITPKASKIPKINKVELFYVDDVKGTTFSFMEKLRVRAYCSSMFNKELVFTLWEDDAKGGGHDVHNKAIDTARARIDAKGVAVAEFMLTKALMQKAMQGEADPKQLEFYVTVEYYKNKKHATENVNVNNPFPQMPQVPQPPHSKPSTPSAKIPKAKGSPAEQKSPSKKEERGIVEMAVQKAKELWDWWESKGTITREKPPTVQKPEGRSPAIVKDVKKEDDKRTNNCGGKFCIKKGDKNELIREINIRLSGFGGNVPTDEFTERTERMIKQFQRDYMKVPETGKICGNVLRAIDEFGSMYSVNINEAKCPCKECKGFGNGLFSEQKNNPKILEKNRKYEYPGIHRVLIWVEKAIKFYLSNQERDKKLRVGVIFSGYRCNANNIKKGRKSTNHMGKALDLHIYGLSNSSNTEASADVVRDLLVKYTKAEYRWGGKNVIALEPSTRNRIGNEFIATTWVHYDVRTFELKYLKDEYFVKDNSSANGESILQLALRMGFSQTCNCLGGGKLENNQNSQKKEDQRVDPKTLKASDKIVEFIKDWEKYSKMPYNDSKGYCTIGYGHLIKKKKCGDIVMPSEFKDGISEEQATELFRKDLKEFELAVQRDVTVKLYQREFDALVDLLFNCGQYFLKNGKAPKLYSNLLDEKYEEAAKEFLDIENRKRRQQNYEIFIHGNYDSAH